MRISRRPRPLGQPSAVTIGSFDGLHLGHQRLIEALNQAAHSRGLASTVVTFEPQPREFFDPDGAPARLAALNDKVRRLSAMGVDQLVVLPFNSALRAMSAAEFVQKILLDGLDARWVQVGDDFRFGNDRRGDVDFLRQYDFEVQQLESQRLGDDRVSSTAIRTCLAEGRLSEAAELLGEPYTLSGRVVHGRKLGRTIGVPTANILLHHPKLATNGVFVVRTQVNDRWIPGVANLGPKPTVGDSRNWLEVHLFDTELDLYGQRLDVQLWQRLRGIERFANLDALKNQIQSDIDQARHWFNSHDLQQQ